MRWHETCAHPNAASNHDDCVVGNPFRLVRWSIWAICAHRDGAMLGQLLDQCLQETKGLFLQAYGQTAGEFGHFQDTVITFPRHTRAFACHQSGQNLANGINECDFGRIMQVHLWVCQHENVLQGCGLIQVGFA